MEAWEFQGGGALGRRELGSWPALQQYCASDKEARRLGVILHPPELRAAGWRVHLCRRGRHREGCEDSKSRWRSGQGDRHKK